MPRRESTASPTPQKVNVSVDMPPASAPPAEVKEEKSPTWFWDMLQEIPKDKWGAEFDVMGWRVDPKPGVQPGGKGFLFLIAEPITLTWIKQNYGGGKFRCILQKNSRFKTSHEFDIEGQPRYDLTREIPNVPASAANGNADFQKEFISVLREELARSRESTQGTSQGTEEVVKMLTNASEKAMEIVTKQTPAAISGVSQIKEMVSALKELGLLTGGPAVAASNPTVDKFLNAAIERLLAPPKSLKEQLEEVKALGELLGGGTSEGGTKNPWLIGLKMLEPHLPEILDSFKTASNNTITAAQARAAEARARAQAAETLRGIPSTAARPAAPVAAQQPANAAPPAPAIHVTSGLQVVPRDAADVDQPAASAPAIESAMPGVAETPTTQEQYDTAMKIQVVNMMRMGATGGAIASFLEDVKPELAKDLAKYPQQTIAEFFLQDPILKLMVEDPRWDAVLADAREYLAEEPVLN